MFLQRVSNNRVGSAKLTTNINNTSKSGRIAWADATKLSMNNLLTMNKDARGDIGLSRFKSLQITLCMFDPSSSESIEAAGLAGPNVFTSRRASNILLQRVVGRDKFANTTMHAIANIANEREINMIISHTYMWEVLGAIGVPGDISFTLTSCSMSVIFSVCGSALVWPMALPLRVVFARDTLSLLFCSWLLLMFFFVALVVLWWAPLFVLLLMTSAWFFLVFSSFRWSFKFSQSSPRCPASG